MLWTALSRVNSSRQHVRELPKPTSVSSWYCAKCHKNFYTEQKTFWSKQRYAKNLMHGWFCDFCFVSSQEAKVLSRCQFCQSEFSKRAVLLGASLITFSNNSLPSSQRLNLSAGERESWEVRVFLRASRPFPNPLGSYSGVCFITLKLFLGDLNVHAENGQCEFLPKEINAECCTLSIPSWSIAGSGNTENTQKRRHFWHAFKQSLCIGNLRICETRPNIFRVYAKNIFWAERFCENPK